MNNYVYLKYCFICSSLTVEIKCWLIILCVTGFCCSVLRTWMPAFANLTLASLSSGDNPRMSFQDYLRSTNRPLETSQPFSVKPAHDLLCVFMLCHLFDSPLFFLLRSGKSAGCHMSTTPSPSGRIVMQPLRSWPVRQGWKSSSGSPTHSMIWTSECI